MCGRGQGVKTVASHCPALPLASDKPRLRALAFICFGPCCGQTVSGCDCLALPRMGLAIGSNFAGSAKVFGPVPYGVSTTPAGQRGGAGVLWYLWAARRGLHFGLWLVGGLPTLARPCHTQPQGHRKPVKGPLGCGVGKKGRARP